MTKAEFQKQVRLIASYRLNEDKAVTKAAMALVDPVLGDLLDRGEAADKAIVDYCKARVAEMGDGRK